MPSASAGSARSSTPRTRSRRSWTSSWSGPSSACRSTASRCAATTGPSYTERVAGWHKATAAPGILRDVLLVDRGPDWAAAAPAGRMTPTVSSTVAWPDDMASYRTRFATELAAWESHPPDEPLRPADLLSPDGATIVVPIAPIPVQNDAGHLDAVRACLRLHADPARHAVRERRVPGVAGGQALPSRGPRRVPDRGRRRGRIDRRPSTRPTSTTWRPSSASTTPRSTSSRSTRISSSSSAWPPTRSATRCQPAPIAGAACSSA